MEFHFEPSAFVQKQEKQKKTYRITPIGGPEEIKKWREMQEAKEMVFKMRLKARDERLETFAKETNQTLDPGVVTRPKWEDKIKFAEEERASLSRRELDVINNPPWEPIPEPKKTVGQRIAGFFKQIWIDANF